jgi:hypothetical protein
MLALDLIALCFILQGIQLAMRNASHIVTNSGIVNGLKLLYYRKLLVIHFLVLCKVFK